MYQYVAVLICIADPYCFIHGAVLIIQIFIWVMWFDWCGHYSGSRTSTEWEVSCIMAGGWLRQTEYFITTDLGRHYLMCQEMGSWGCQETSMMLVCYPWFGTRKWHFRIRTLHFYFICVCARTYACGWVHVKI